MHDFKYNMFIISVSCIFCLVNKKKLKNSCFNGIFPFHILDQSNMLYNLV